MIGADNSDNHFGTDNNKNDDYGSDIMRIMMTMRRKNQHIHYSFIFIDFNLLILLILIY